MRKYLRDFIALSSLVLISGHASVHADGHDAIPGRFIVRLSSKSEPANIRKSLSSTESFNPALPSPAHKTSPALETLAKYYIFNTVDSTMTPADVVQRFGGDVIESVEPDYQLELFTVPHDSLVSHQWYLINTGQSYYGINRRSGMENDSLIYKSGKVGIDLGLGDLYASPPADTQKVVVAIVDTGVDPEHPELRGRLWRNLDEIPGNNTDDDHNGFVDDTLGYDVSGDRLTLFNPVGDNDPTDINGHGTHIAGIVAANANDAGVAGIAPWVEIMPVKIFPNGLVSVGAQGIIYAVSAGAKVINLSWGTPFVSGLMQAALQYAREQGVFVCIASGNSGTNETYYPAAFDSTFVVGAANSAGFVTDFSTFGHHVDIVAPGLDILSLRATNTDMYAPGGEPNIRIIGSDSAYYLSDGTSMASPMVAAAAAVLFSFRPGLTVSQVEHALELGALDLLDPYGIGDSLPGLDTISGWGYLNIGRSLSFAESGRAFIVSPMQRGRYVGDVPVKIASIDDNFSGQWSLDLKRNREMIWETIASGTGIPSDSIAVILTDSLLIGHVSLRLTGDGGLSHTVTIVRVDGNKLRIESPGDGEEMSFSIPVSASAYGADFDSAVVWYSRTGSSKTRLHAATAEFFDSLLFNWTVSGIDTGNFTLYLDGYFDSGIVSDTVGIRVKSAFAPGWPQKAGGWLAVTPVAADLDRNGTKEIVVTSSAGIYVFERKNGGIQLAEGFPVMTTIDTRGVPAIYDLNYDGRDEIIFCYEDGIFALQADGTPLSGWPRPAYTGEIPFGYEYPNPIICKLGTEEDSAVALINVIGQILAYRFSGESFFYSRWGLFSSYNARLSDMSQRGGNSSPVVASVDVDNDGVKEVVASYSSPQEYSGLGIYESRTGRPIVGDSADLVNVPIANVDGMVLADLTGDGMPEVVIAGFDGSNEQRIWVSTHGNKILPGWPVTMPEVSQWIGSFPTVADLDLDGKGEVLQAFFEYDISSLYIWKGDGTPYRNIAGRPTGEVYTAQVTFSTPVVADILGDSYPEIIIRSGYIIPGTGPERVYVFDYQGNPVPGYPMVTPTPSYQVFSSRFTPLIDDLDNDGLVEMALCSDANDIFVWECEAGYAGGKNKARLLADNLNSSVIPPFATSDDGSKSDGNATIPRIVVTERNLPGAAGSEVSIECSAPCLAKIELCTSNGKSSSLIMEGHVAPGVRTFPVSSTVGAPAYYKITIGGAVTIQPTGGGL